MLFRSPKAIFAAMGGAIVQSITCTELPYQSVRTEPFYQVSVDVVGMGDLDRALDSYFQEELMEGDNAYYCEQVQQKVGVPHLTVSDLVFTFQ